MSPEGEPSAFALFGKGSAQLIPVESRRFMRGTTVLSSICVSADSSS